MLTKKDLELLTDAIKKNLETERIHTTRLIIESEQRTKQNINVAVETAKSEIRADIFNINAKLINKIQRHENSINALHKGTDIPDPNKH